VLRCAQFFFRIFAVYVYLLVISSYNQLVMDLVIQMLPPSLRKFSTHIDFVGQRKAERLLQVG
jgi:hypothetical protein